jgi:hypothetical protein
MSEKEFRETDHADRVVQRVARAHDITVEFSDTAVAFFNHRDEIFESVPRLNNGLFRGAEILMVLGY